MSAALGAVPRIRSPDAALSPLAREPLDPDDEDRPVGLRLSAIPKNNHSAGTYPSRRAESA
jgi:hypothetical protein